ncbi:MAG: hypothetical protein OEZ35_00735 [Candidatus Bathyarchaeota archaeon]|nr:hypothetical protein [Candidatus Bathyarchaeota archaeon]
MRLLQGLRGISKLMFIILLLLAFIAGATLSYIWTMGYYASPEFQLPKKANITIEDVAFPAQDATFFNVTILNPSYSLSSVKVSQIVVLTNDGILHEVEAQDLQNPLEAGSSRTFRGFWDWANYTGQTVKVIVYVAEGSGANVQTEIPPYVKLTVEAYFNSSISVQHFNVTFQNAEASVTYVNITELTVNGETIPTENITVNGEPVSFPYFLNSSESVLFECLWNWTDYQGETVTVAVKTLQGYMAKHIVANPQPVELTITKVVFNSTISTDYFNVTLSNSETSGAYVDISEISLQVNGEIVDITEWAAYPEQRVEPRYSVLLVCTWNWQDHKGNTATVTIGTLQGFQVSSEEITIPD